MVTDAYPINVLAASQAIARSAYRRRCLTRGMA